MTFTPDLFTFENGMPVKSAADWEARRRELLRLICEEEFGYMPPMPKRVSGRVTQTEESPDGLFVRESIDIAFDAEKGDFCLPVKLYLPQKGEAPFPLILHFGAEENGPSFPAELLMGNGFALCAIDHNAVSRDNDDFSDGLAGLYERKNKYAFGKLALWMFAACRVLDYLLTRPELAPDSVAICGHSRLGKAALYAGAMDERIRYTLANNSGCGGDALEQTKHEGAETVPYMNTKFSHWFCENHQKYSETPIWEKIDQHFLVGAIAPRYVAIASAALDRWADPYSQQLTAVAASPAWELLGVSGFCGGIEPFSVGERNNQGHIAYHLREGGHSLSREDWAQYIDFIKKHE